MAKKWKDLLGAVAPAIGTALGGPLGGMAAGVLAEKLGLPAQASQKDIGDAIAALSPADYVKLKQANLEFESKMAELDVDMERLAVSDRASARDRQVKTGDRTPNLLAFVIVPGFFLSMGTMFFYGGAVQGGIKDVLMAMIGLLGGLTTGVANYFFGSSRGSKDKTALLDKALDNKGR